MGFDRTAWDARVNGNNDLSIYGNGKESLIDLMEVEIAVGSVST